jgi:hypothetical protein
MGVSDDEMDALLTAVADAQSVAEAGLAAVARNPAAQSLAVLGSAITLGGRAMEDAAGQTFVYNTETESYEVDDTRTDAPPDGVRFALYAVSGTPQLIVPLQEIGYVDLSSPTDTTLAVLAVVDGATVLSYSANGSVNISPRGILGYLGGLHAAGSLVEASREVAFDLAEEQGINPAGIPRAVLDYDLTVPSVGGIQMGYEGWGPYLGDQTGRGTLRVAFDEVGGPQSDSSVVEVEWATWDECRFGSEGIIKLNGEPVAEAKVLHGPPPHGGLELVFIAFGDTTVSDILTRFWQTFAACRHFRASLTDVVGNLLSPIVSTLHDQSGQN